ncbi:MAG: DNA-binding protein [Planctomycetes bacterium]|nr:DNA-binding protein [Planctomycetota bacterium]
MKKAMSLFGMVALVAFALTSGSLAQQGRGPRGGGWGPGGPYGRLYDPKTVETVEGEVVSVDKVAPMKGMGNDIHLRLKLEKEEGKKEGEEAIAVHLGPDWYIENQETEVQAKDRIEVKGSRITFEGKPAIIAAEVRKGDEVLELRDEDGYPVWAGWRRRAAK